jgi:hypothetical protein
MRRRTIAYELACLAALWLGHRPVAGGQIITPPQTVSIPMIQTNWGPGTPGINDPLNFQGFDSTLGTLTGVELTLSLTVRNDFLLVFPATPTPTTLYAATTQTTDPSVLANPSLVKQLTDGPGETLMAPDRSTQLFGGPGARLPVDVVSLTEPSGTWSSMLPVTDPHFIPPSIATISLTRTLDPSVASLLAEFIGKGTINLGATAAANSSFYSDSGNGSGTVLTSASATVTVQYVYTTTIQASIPEPSSAILLALGIGGGFLAYRLRRPAAHPAESGRA